MCANLSIQIEIQKPHWKHTWWIRKKQYELAESRANGRDVVLVADSQCEHITNNDIDSDARGSRLPVLESTVKLISICDLFRYFMNESNRLTDAIHSFFAVVIRNNKIIIIMWNKKKSRPTQMDPLCGSVLCCRECDTIYDAKYIAIAFFTVHNHK